MGQYVTQPSVTAHWISIREIHFDVNPTIFIDNFIAVEKRSGSSGSYVWTKQETGWRVFTTSGPFGSTFRNVDYTIDNSVEAGVYRFVLKKDSFTTNQPTSDSISPEFSNSVSKSWKFDY